ncbi:MAG: glycoside hydrolase/phage tail family protein [Devosia nanyangense]|uniref:Glycoside hydrolase/phage tail family protein n=1 Tax=Devosia nanyangense TaxID=1228055 RepID=A0A933L3G5_9HYPH|nr:glycoside hydrolase/phage tail family protein [Devosia nanyangense]
MATLALSLAGQVVGGALGGPIGATIGRALGALAGSAVDNVLFGETPAAGTDIRLQGSSEGAPIPRLYGWSRLSGNIIWATDLEQLSDEDSGAKGTGADEAGIAASFALGLCEGEVHRLGRIWADGQLLETEGLTLRFYRGTETQDADSLIEAKQGADNAPAYRGLCYIVFERLPLAPFGNRIPNLSVELCHVVGELEPAIRAVTVIPAAAEFGYDPEPRLRLVSAGVTEAENAHQSRDVSDWTLSIDELMALCPNLEHVSLVVAWFGDDLRCGTCTIRPKVEATARTIKGGAWSVAGLTRAGAQVVSTHDGGPAYGGTPSDDAVLAAIADLKARGLGVTLYPIVLMDIPAGNPLGQPAYPWRGRIACLPASDGTAAATSEVNAFLGSGSGWDLRRMILHYAQLADDAGGVDAMLIGSEMRGLSFARGAGNTFPFVAGLVTLAADVRAIVGSGTKLTYGADWSEYSGYQPGGGEKFFHLDPLWASADIDAVGIDNYMPLADWRTGPGGPSGPDAADWDGPYDTDYLQANIAGGEGFDWHYASDADRLAGTRTPIAESVYGEPWVWRFKDLVGWWSNAHHNRPGGVRSGSATAWVPKSKPLWFTELGCGAVDKGANQPNVFSDPKSSESAKPYFSNGAPDALAQRQVLRADLGYWADNANNPASSEYSGRMLERMYLWTWDARPYPAFPAELEVWSDGANHATGHWLTGRLGGVASDELARAVAAEFGVTLGDVEAQPPFVHGYVIEGPSTGRAALEPLLTASGLAVHDTPDGLVLMRASEREAVVIDEVVAGEGPLIARRRPDPGEAIGQVALSYADRERNYLGGSVTAMAPGSGPLEAASAGLVLDLGGARATAERLLLERTAARDSIDFTAPPSLAGLEVGDAVAIAGEMFEIVELRDGLARRITARSIPPHLDVVVIGGRPGGGTTPTPRAEPVLDAVHLPPSADDLTRTRLALGAFAKPWPGSVAVTEDGTGASLARLARSATLGVLTGALGAGSIYLWDDLGEVTLELYSGHLSSKDDDEVLAGANRIAIETDAGQWEVIGFADAELTAPNTYRLTHLLRGQWGTDHAIGPAAAGKRVLLVDSRATLLPVAQAWLDTTVTLRSYAGTADTVGTASDLALDVAPAMPLAPVHLCASRVAGGSDVTLSWVRRSRADTDSWAPDDAPLDCAPEAYRVAIYSGATLKRTIDVTAAAATYSAGQQTADFGSPPASFDFEVAQTSPVFGPGHWAKGEFHA